MKVKVRVLSHAFPEIRDFQYKKRKFKICKFSGQFYFHLHKESLHFLIILHLIIRVTNEITI